MATSDMRAADVINGCRAERIEVPAQVAVVGVDNDAAQHAKCGMGISSVVLNMRTMGRSAVRELDFLFRHPKWKGRPHESLIPADRVFAGESSAVPTSSLRLVCAAKEFIAANRMRRISPTDVAAHLKCSRQLVELRFAQLGEKTVKKTIEASRMEEAKRLLESGRAGKDVAKAMHFTSANQFYRIFKRHFGHTLRQSDI